MSDGEPSIRHIHVVEDYETEGIGRREPDATSVNNSVTFAVCLVQWVVVVVVVVSHIRDSHS